MLGEAILHVLNYTEESPKRTPKPNSLLQMFSNTVPPQESAASLLSSRSPRISRSLRVSEKSRHLLTPVTCMALPIPNSSVEDLWDPELNSLDMPSPSFFKAYPDLQLAGGSLGPLNPTPQSQGPLLNSNDFASLETSVELGNLVEAQSKPDEGYLVMESIKSLEKEQRLTNSMLNGFLEKQLMEVYRQHMQDSLARCTSSSITTSVVPGICGNLYTSNRKGTAQGEDLHSGQSQSSVRYLSNCSAPHTSQFSTPVLRISYQQE